MLIRLNQLLCCSLYSGLGAEKSHEDNWISHQVAFDDLLSQLNNHAENDNGEITNSFTYAFEYLSLLPWVSSKNFYVSIIFLVCN